MLDVSKLNVGDIVKIVDAWVPGCRENTNGYMDKYLGQLVTVRAVKFDSIRIEEDIDDPKAAACHQDGWVWFAPALEPYDASAGTDDDIPTVSDAEFMSSLSILGL